MGGGVLSGAEMAAWWVWALLALALGASRGLAAVDDASLLEIGRRALCMASHSRIARSHPHSPSLIDYRAPLSCAAATFNVFLIFNVRPCSGVLLSESHVITSDYCAEHAQNGTAFIGGHKYQSPDDLLKPEVQMALIFEFFSYVPKGDAYLDHDVIICKLDRKIAATGTIGYARLTSLTRWLGKQPGMLMGFGETFEGDSAHELRSGAIYLECGHMCASEVTTMTLGDNALCGSNASSMFVMCWGDMGGAVTDMRGELIALISYKQMKKPTWRLCADPPGTTFFMFLGYYRDWINSIINPVENSEE